MSASLTKASLALIPQVPLFALLLFGGPITVQHFVGGVMLGKDGFIKLRANTRIAVLCSQLRCVYSFHLRCSPAAVFGGLRCVNGCSRISDTSDDCWMRNWPRRSRVPTLWICKDTMKWFRP